MHDIAAVSTVHPLSSQDVIRGDTTYRDAAFIAAVANLIRDHGQALVEALADSERLEWIARKFRICSLDMGSQHRYAPSSSLGDLRGPTFIEAVDKARSKTVDGGSA
jgi:hypothetical protein